MTEYIKNNYYNIIGKKAFDVSLGIILTLNHWIAKASFSQHIPYKIDTIEKISTSQEGEKQNKISTVVGNLIFLSEG